MCGMHRREEQVAALALVLDDAHGARERRLLARAELRAQRAESGRGRLGQCERAHARHRLRFIVLVADVADQLLEQVLERHEAERLAAPP